MHAHGNIVSSKTTRELVTNIRKQKAGTLSQFIEKGTVKPETVEGLRPDAERLASFCGALGMPN